ncbi:MAG: YDG domain-containing protein [Aquabacterium sp.]|jgi:filamentous hemagglutinin family protein|uniref:YDG domain-containing protein n=1 Tax=Aquabacterium sp. TaxID=1872578 RepID=UPI003BB16E2A
MNHVYRLIWREAAGGFVAVSEMARACGARTASKAAAVSSALLLVAGAQAAGTGFNVVDGSATRATNGATSTVTQTSHGVRIDWQTLGVAAGETLKFIQPSASAVALNVIKGGVATEILGQLQANGNVFILNPDGVLVRAGAQVSVGGFLGSTNDLVSFNPATGALVLQANNSTAEVNNAGSIVATQGGMVALVGNKVINSGTIVAPGGGIYLLAGDRVEFTPADGSPFTYSLTTDTTRAKSVANIGKGSLSAAGGAIVMDARSTKQAVVNARGVISAGSVSQGPDGSIRLTALGGKGEITSTGKLSAGASGHISAELDAGGHLVYTVGDPNNAAPAPSNDQWLTAQDKTYDGTDAANVAVNLTSFGQAAFFLDFTLGQAKFTSRNANEQATVTVSGTIIQPEGGQILLPKSLTAAIHQAELTVTSGDVSKTYDGTTSALGSAVVLSGLVQGDSVSGGNFAFTNKNAGTGKTVTVDGVTVDDGNNGGNYKVTYVDNTTSNIDRAQLTLSAVSDTKSFDNTTSSTGAPQVSGLVANDNVASLSQAFDSSAVGARTLNVNGYVLNDGNNGNNYEVTLVTASGAITNPPPPNPPTNTPDLGSVINNGGNVPTQLNVDLAGLGDLLAQLPPTAAGEEDDPKKIKARRRSDRSPLRVTDGGVNTPPTLR